MDTPQKIFFLTQQNSPYSMASGGLFAFQGGVRILALFFAVNQIFARKGDIGQLHSIYGLSKELSSSIADIV